MPHPAGSSISQRTCARRAGMQLSCGDSRALRLRIHGTTHEGNMRRTHLQALLTIWLATIPAYGQPSFGLSWPNGWPDLAPWDPAFPTGPLPSRFDWSELFPHPVRNQIPCGSCWAFATIGALEYQILINERLHVDLSEQWLINCNHDGWSQPCSQTGGGFVAHNYFWPAASEADECGDDG